MSRRPRCIVPGKPQHVTHRGIDRAPVFVAVSDRLFFAECLQAACRRYECSLHAYAFMTNHVHLVLTPWTSTALARTMQSVGRRYVQYFNIAYRRTGSLWEGRYRASVIDTDRYLLACYRYVELNPVRAGLVTHPAHYQWSSHRANALGEVDPLVTPHPTFASLGADVASRCIAYRHLFRDALDEATLRDIRLTTRRGMRLAPVDVGMGKSSAAA